MNCTPLLIVAVSARALAVSAHKAGLATYVLDLFADTDTQRVALAYQQVQAQTYNFDDTDLLEQVHRLCPTNTALVYGSGFEHNPALLAKLAQGRYLYGNTPDILQFIKDPQAFFGLLHRQGIPHPETRLTPPTDTSTGWLVKHIGGTGGYHVQPLKTVITEKKSACYYQRQLAGNPHSVLFLANGKTAEIIGYNEQWINEDFASTPYLYAGAMRVDDMPFQPEITEVVNCIVKETGLKGLCGMDMILNATGFHVLEINPRPPASFELHQIKGNLFYWHLQATMGKLPTSPLAHPRYNRAKRILYALKTLNIPRYPQWSAWTADQPRPNSVIQRGEPICTIFAQGRNCKALILKREQQLQTLLKRWQENTA
ncbi:putative ATP-dependent carboligase [Beggiatoa alba B18LD]|uniref:Putative ATP-dependent carboligase n=1 Tax=Beggiatoa alba B18LD TaxID=395493 RepID=I3CEJ9_9GAMM|nr:ATP-grasp domain-containing protein [Beggiatoa alba]EIJ42042.1 putative ATP-dependent carboligase [Beggiatoa alba B18LD]